MEWFLIWNGIGVVVNGWSLIRVKDKTLADVLFHLSFIPMWPILLYMTNEV